MQLSLLRRGGDEENYISSVEAHAHINSRLPRRQRIRNKQAARTQSAFNNKEYLYTYIQKNWYRNDRKNGQSLPETHHSKIILRQFYAKCQKTKKERWNFNVRVVEMRRVELLSESISARISPSAAADLNFAKQDAPRQASSSAIPSFPCASGSRHRVFLYNWRRDSDLQVNQSRRRGRFMRQAAMLQMRNYCYF